MTGISLLLVSLIGADQVIDEFRYADPQTAGQTWVASSGTPPVELTTDGGRAVLKMVAPFATDPKLPRTVIDRELNLDLAAPGEFSLEVVSDSPEVFTELTLYFRSGGGWYGSGGSLTKQGWHTVRFSKASFRSEGSPTGWHKIDGVRIAAWRSRSQDASLLVRRLAAVSHDVALVVDPETRAEAERLAGMLAELGLGADAIEESALARGALGNRRVAVLPHNPKLAGEAAAALERFVRDGGKLLACYQLPDRLGAALGFGNPRYVKQRRPGDFAEIRFDADDVRGLPRSVRQASWNVTVAEPTGPSARVIARWYDDAGKPTGHAAMLLSDQGAFFSHVVLADDRPGKQQLLGAVLGHLAPPLWEQMAQNALDRSESVGHCHGLGEVTAHVKAHGDDAARRCLESAIEIRARAGQQAAADLYPEAANSARESREILAEAYLRAQPSPRREGRAVWNHSGTGAYPGDWERSAKELAAAGFNMVLPNMLWAGRAHYASDVLPRTSTFEQYGDQVAQCVAAAKKHGLEVHVWKVNFNLSGAPKEFVEDLRRQGRLQVTAQGETHRWLCPSHPENQKLEAQSMLEVARKYAVDGLHFDYIRYPGRETCYCDGCRKRFEAATDRKVLDWPRECYSGSRREEYNDWRCKQITRLVGEVHRQAKALRPELKISAAVFGAYPACRDSVAQEWPQWVKAGWLDFVCPMDYTESDLGFASLVENQLRLVGGRTAVYPGIGATASRSGLSPDRVVGQIHHARSLGASGFTIFDFSGRTAESIIPGVGLGVGARKAVPPHTRP